MVLTAIILFSLTASVGHEFSKGSAEWSCLGAAHVMMVRQWLELERQASGAAGNSLYTSFCPFEYFHMLLQELFLWEIVWASLRKGHFMSLSTTWQLRACTNILGDTVGDAYLSRLSLVSHSTSFLSHSVGYKLVTSLLGSKESEHGLLPLGARTLGVPDYRGMTEVRVGWEIFLQSSWKLYVYKIGSLKKYINSGKFLCQPVCQRSCLSFLKQFRLQFHFESEELENLSSGNMSNDF